MSVKGSGGAGALKEPIDSNRSFPVMSTLSIVLAELEFFWHMLDFRSIVSCLGFGKQTCGWAICMTTLATNFLSCSSVKNILFVLGYGRVFCLRLGHIFLIANHMLLKCLFFFSFILDTLLYDATCGLLQLAHFGFLASLFGHPL